MFAKDGTLAVILLNSFLAHFRVVFILAQNDHKQTETATPIECVSFLANTKSIESTLNLCFTMPVTFYFYKFCTK
jgi:hypothetical protein